MDTNILSEPAKPQPDSRVGKWIADHEADFWTSALVAAELLNGLEGPVTVATASESNRFCWATLTAMERWTC